MNFIERYVEYASTLAAAPPRFHRMMAYAMLAQVIGRRPLFQQSGPPVGPNLWFLILGPSSTVAKSSALVVGKRILSTVYDGGYSHFLPTGGSSENFFERLEENPSGIFLNSEFINLVNWFKLSYANDVQGLLLEAYDQPKTIYKSIGTRHKNTQKTYIIKAPFLNAYAVSSHDLFNSVINQSLLTGGFLPRWILVREDAEGNYKPFTAVMNEDTENGFAADLREIKLQQLDGNYTYTEKAATVYTQWFNDWLKPQIKGGNSEFLTAYCQRRVTDLHKVAMIHAVLRGSFGSMDENDVSVAIQMMSQAIEDAGFLALNKISLDKEESECNRVFDYIVKFGKEAGCPHGKALRYSHLSAFRFDRNITTLVQSGRIIKEEVKTGRTSAFFYRPVSEIPG